LGDDLDGIGRIRRRRGGLEETRQNKIQGRNALAGMDATAPGDKNGQQCATRQLD
jgi:hypothetical protein